MELVLDLNSEDDTGAAARRSAGDPEHGDLPRNRAFEQRARMARVPPVEGGLAADLIGLVGVVVAPAPRSSAARSKRNRAARRADQRKKGKRG